VKFEGKGATINHRGDILITEGTVDYQPRIVAAISTGSWVQVESRVIKALKEERDVASGNR